MRALRLVGIAALSLAAASGCLGRAEDLVDDSNARVFITGAAAGDVISVEVADERRELTALDAEPLVVYLQLEEGEHNGLLRVEREPPRCVSFVLLLDDESDEDDASADVRSAAPCDDPADGDAGDGGPEDGGPDAGPVPDAGPSPDDAGPAPDDAGPDPSVFVHLAERLPVEPCLGVLCVETTRVDADGRVTFIDVTAVEVSGQVSAADVEAAALATLSAEADALFEGEDPQCPQPRPDELVGIELERRFRAPGEDVDVVETVGVAGCGGVADELRARLAFLRLLALGL